jgi:predicted nucleic acid-binding protein
VRLIDTSSWVEQLRRGGDTAVRLRVETLLSSGEAAWCPVVRLELWNGARSAAERAVLAEMESDIESLEISPVVWEQAIRLARAARERGVTVPATDLLVAACAVHHGAAIEHNDTHFDLIAKLAP